MNRKPGSLSTYTFLKAFCLWVWDGDGSDASDKGKEHCNLEAHIGNVGVGERRILVRIVNEDC